MVKDEYNCLVKSLEKTDPRVQAHKLVAEAVSLREYKKYEEAIHLCLEATKLLTSCDPSNDLGIAHNDLAINIYWTQHFLEECLEHLEKVYKVQLILSYYVTN